MDFKPFIIPKLSFDAFDAGEFKESEHPRGQPDNKGEFASSGSSGGGGGQEPGKGSSDLKQTMQSAGFKEQGGKFVHPISGTTVSTSGDPGSSKFKWSVESGPLTGVGGYSAETLVGALAHLTKPAKKPEQKTAKAGGGFSAEENKQFTTWAQELDSPERKALKTSNEFGKLLDKLPTYKGKVYRGAMVPKSELAALKPGSGYTMNAHNSASRSNQTADDFAAAFASENEDKNSVPVRFELDQHSGADLKGVEAAQFGAGADEAEVVLKKGTKYRVVAVSPVKIKNHSEGRASFPGYKVVLQEA